MSAMRPKRSWRTGTCMVRVDIIDMRQLNKKPIQQSGQHLRRHTRTLLTLVLLTFGLSGVSRADTVVVTADRMIDVVAGKVVEHPRITITDGRITAVGSAVDSQATVPAQARRIDLPGMTL